MLLGYCWLFMSLQVDTLASLSKLAWLFGGFGQIGGNKALSENGLFPMTTAAPLAKKSLFWPPTDSVNRIPMLACRCRTRSAKSRSEWARRTKTAYTKRGSLTRGTCPLPTPQKIRPGGRKGLRGGVCGWEKSRRLDGCIEATEMVHKHMHHKPGPHHTQASYCFLLGLSRLDNQQNIWIQKSLKKSLIWFDMDGYWHQQTLALASGFQSYGVGYLTKGMAFRVRYHFENVFCPWIPFYDYDF